MKIRSSALTGTPRAVLTEARGNAYLACLQAPGRCAGDTSGDASLGAAACTFCCLWPARAVPWLEAGSRARPICESMLVLVRQHLNTTSARSCSKCTSIRCTPSCANGHHCRSDADRGPSERQALNMTLLHETSKPGAARGSLVDPQGWLIVMGAYKRMPTARTPAHRCQSAPWRRATYLSPSRPCQPCRACRACPPVDPGRELSVPIAPLLRPARPALSPLLG